MATFVDGYGLGLTDITAPYAVSFGHPGSNFGFIAWAGCLPDSGSVIVTLSNTGVEDITLPRSLGACRGVRCRAQAPRRESSS